MHLRMKMVLIGFSEMYSPRYIEELGEAAMGTVVTRPLPQELMIRYEEFIEEAEEFGLKLSGSPEDYYTFYAYDAINTIIDAILAADSTDSGKIADAMKCMGPHYGLTGEVAFDEKGFRRDQLFVLSMVAEGDEGIVWIDIEYVFGGIDTEIEYISLRGDTLSLSSITREILSTQVPGLRSYDGNVVIPSAMDLLEATGGSHAEQSKNEEGLSGHHSDPTSVIDSAPSRQELQKEIASSLGKTKWLLDLGKKAAERIAAGVAKNNKWDEVSHDARFFDHCKIMFVTWCVWPVYKSYKYELAYRPRYKFLYTALSNEAIEAECKGKRDEEKCKEELVNKQEGFRFTRTEYIRGKVTTNRHTSTYGVSADLGVKKTFFSGSFQTTYVLENTDQRQRMFSQKFSGDYMHVFELEIEVKLSLIINGKKNQLAKLKIPKKFLIYIADRDNRLDDNELPWK